MAKTDKLIRDQLGSIMERVEPIAFNKEASWQKLNTRLQPQRKKIVFKPAYRWAAAVVLLLTITVAVLNKLENIHLTKTTHLTSHPVTKEIPQEPETHVIVLKTKNISIYTHKPTSEHLQLYEVPLPTTSIPSEFTKEPSIPDESLTKAKPVMKVIHSNDLAEIEHIEKELKRARYVFHRGNTSDSINMTTEDLELPEQFKKNRSIKH